MHFLLARCIRQTGYAADIHFNYMHLQNSCYFYQLVEGKASAIRYMSDSYSRFIIYQWTYYYICFRNMHQDQHYLCGVHCLRTMPFITQNVIISLRAKHELRQQTRDPF